MNTEAKADEELRNALFKAVLSELADADGWAGIEEEIQAKNIVDAVLAIIRPSP